MIFNGLFTFPATVLLCVAAIVCSVIVLGILFLPTIVAAIRKHRQFIPIMILNIFLFWTFIAWAVALAWAFTKESQDEIITIKKESSTDKQAAPTHEPPPAS